MPFKIIKSPKGYFVENIETRKRYSKHPLSETKAKQQFRILNKYLHTLEGSGINKGEAKQISKKPLTDLDIKKYLPDTPIMSHQDLKNYNSIDQLLPNQKDDIIIIYEAKPQFGHWVLLSKYIDKDTHKPTIQYFDSYGNQVDEPLKWIDKKYENKIDDTPYLTKLLTNAQNKYDIIYNSKDFQVEKDNIATCGRHCVLRALTILNDNQGLSDYIKMMNTLKQVTGFNYDDIVSAIINI